MIKTKQKVTHHADFIAKSAIIATLYVVLTLISNSVGLASGVIQIRLSESLAILSYFTPCAIYGLTIGCFLSNLLTGACIIDIIFGTLATFIGVLIAHFIKKYKYLVPLPTILSNTIIIPLVLRYGYGLVDDSIPYMALTVGIGEIISCGALGLILLLTLEKNNIKL